MMIVKIFESQNLHNKIYILNFLWMLLAKGKANLYLYL